MNPAVDQVINRIASTTYVILVKDPQGNPTLIMDPGLGQPWHSKNKRLADFHASKCNGEARTFREAWDILMKACPGFELNLIDRVNRAARHQTLSKLAQPKNLPPGILDQHGNPLH